MNFKRPEGQVARWIERLQQYNFKIVHRRGRLHGNADILSRRPCLERQCRYCKRLEEQEELVEEVSLQATTVKPEDDEDGITLEGLRKTQKKDNDLKVVREWLKNGVRPTWQEIAKYGKTIKGYWTQWDSLYLHDGLLHRKWESPDGVHIVRQVILPKSQVRNVLEELHSSHSGGHFGTKRTLARVRERFYWVNCRRDVEDWCKECDLCNGRKGPKTRSRGKMAQYLSGEPFERIAIDILGPLPLTERGNKYLMVVMDYFSKWPEIVPIPNQEATTLAEAFMTNVIARHGVPLELHSDQGRNFESELWQELMKLLGIKKTRTTPFHPQSDGMVERHNRTICQYLSMFVSDNQKDWDTLIPLFLLAYRSSEHETTRYTPSMMISGREMKLPHDLLFGRQPPGEEEGRTPPTYIQNLEERLEKVYEFARQRLKVNSDKAKARIDMHATGTHFERGDPVWLYNPRRRKGLCQKLQRNWEGPYTVLKKINDLIYRIQLSAGSKPKVVHIEKLAPYRGPDPPRWLQPGPSSQVIRGE